jgi:hypothetical protein
VNVDVSVDTVIRRPVDEVAAYVGDPTNAPQWYANISSAVPETEPPLAVGSRITFVAHFLRRRIAYTYEITDLVPGRRLVMRTAEGPFPMDTSYTWQPVDGGTRIVLRNRGTPRGFGALAAPFVSSAVRRATTKDLAALKRILEARETD